MWRQAHVETAHFYTNKQVDHLIKETEVLVRLQHSHTYTLTTTSEVASNVAKLGSWMSVVFVSQEWNQFLRKLTLCKKTFITICVWKVQTGLVSCMFFCRLLVVCCVVSVTVLIQNGPEKIAQSLMHHHFATLCSRITRFSQKYAEINS